MSSESNFFVNSQAGKLNNCVYQSFGTLASAFPVQYSLNGLRNAHNVWQQQPTQQQLSFSVDRKLQPSLLTVTVNTDVLQATSLVDASLLENPTFTLEFDISQPLYIHRVIFSSLRVAFLVRSLSIRNFRDVLDIGFVPVVTRGTLTGILLRRCPSALFVHNASGVNSFFLARNCDPNLESASLLSLLRPPYSATGALEILFERDSCALAVTTLACAQMQLNATGMKGIGEVLFITPLEMDDMTYKIRVNLLHCAQLEASINLTMNFLESLSGINSAAAATPSATLSQSNLGMLQFSGKQLAVPSVKMNCGSNNSSSSQQSIACIGNQFESMFGAAAPGPPFSTPQDRLSHPGDAVISPGCMKGLNNCFNPCSMPADSMRAWSTSSASSFSPMSTMNDLSALSTAGMAMSAANMDPLLLLNCCREQDGSSFDTAALMDPLKQGQLQKDPSISGKASYVVVSDRTAVKGAAGAIAMVLSRQSGEESGTCPVYTQRRTRDYTSVVSVAVKAVAVAYDYIAGEGKNEEIGFQPFLRNLDKSTDEYMSLGDDSLASLESLESPDALSLLSASSVLDLPSFSELTSSLGLSSLAGHGMDGSYGGGANELSLVGGIPGDSRRAELAFYVTKFPALGPLKPSNTSPVKVTAHSRPGVIAKILVKLLSEHRNIVLTTAGGEAMHVAMTAVVSARYRLKELGVNILLMPKFVTVDTSKTLGWESVFLKFEILRWDQKLRRPSM